MSLWNKIFYPSRRQAKLPDGDNLAAFGWLVGVWCWLLLTRQNLSPAMGMAAGLFILIVLLIIKYVLTTRRLLAPVGVLAFADTPGPLVTPEKRLANAAPASHNKSAKPAGGAGHKTTPGRRVKTKNNPMPSTSRSSHNLDQALTLVNQLGQILATSLHLLDITSICQTVLSSPQLQDLFQFDLAEIRLWDDHAHALTTALRWPDQARNGAAYADWVAAHQAPLLIADTRQPDLPAGPAPDNYAHRSFMGVPLKVGLKLLGTLELAAAPVNAYRQQDVLLLEILANQIAIALDHARLFQETQRKVAELSLLFETGRELSATLSYDDLLDSLSRQMLKAFSIENCAIFELDEATGALKLAQAGGETPPDQTDSLDTFNPEAFGRIIADLPAWDLSLKTHAPFVINADEAAPKILDLLNQARCGAIAALPLVCRDTVTGMVALFAADPQAVSVEQMPLAQSLVNQAGMALDNARLFGLTDQRLQRRVDELAGLQRVSGELNSTLELGRILSLVIAEAIRVTQADLATISLYDTAAGQLTARQAGRLSGEVTPPDSPAGQTMLEHVLHLGQAVLIADVQQYKDYTGFDPDTRSRVVAPIYYGSEPAGVINLESARLNAFTENQQRYLEALANQAGVAIGNAQAYETQKREREQAGRRIEQLSRLAEISHIFRTNRPLHEVLEDIAYAITESVGYKVVLVSLAANNPPALYHEVSAGIPLPEFEELRQSTTTQTLAGLKEIMRDEFRLSRAYFIPAERREVWAGKLTITGSGRQRLSDSPTGSHLWQPGDLLFVPLTDTEDKIIGLLTVEDPDTGERPTIASVQTLEIFANHAATAIENARLLELEQHRRRQADTLRGVAEAISSQLEFDELLNIVLGELANVVDYASVSVLRLDEDSLTVIGGRAWEHSQHMVGATFSMMDVNPYRLVIETQEPVLIKDARQQYPQAFSMAPYDRLRGWLGVPLTYGTNILGVLSLGSTELDFFTREDADVALTFANQVAVAMQNARLFDEARQQVRQLAALTEVAQALNRALDLEAVLNLVLGAVFDLVGQRQGSIWLVDNQSNTVKMANTYNTSDFLVQLFNESAISVDSEPFASVIKSGEVLVVQSGGPRKDNITGYGLPFPADVTYVPLKTEAGVIGILAIEAVIHHENMLQLVTTLADLAAIAMDNTRLLENTRQRANEMQSLYNLGVQVTGLLDVQQVMCEVVSHTMALTETQLGVLLFWDDELQRYRVEGSAAEKLLSRVIFDPPTTAAEADWPHWLELTGFIRELGQPININLPGPGQPAANAEPEIVAALLARSLGVQAMLGVPIQVQNQTTGAIFVASATPRRFNLHDIQLLSFAANQAVVSVRNAQLVQSLNQLTEELEQRVAQRTEELAQTLQDLTEERDRVETLYQITRELSASLDLDRILSQSLSLINRAVDVSHGSILLVNHETGGLVYRAALGRDTPLPRTAREAQKELDYILARQTIELRQHQIIPDLSAHAEWTISGQPLDCCSAIAVPLITGDDVVGALLFFHPEANYFTADHLKLIAAAASQVATAINNAELYRLITDQADRLGVMLRTQAAEAAKNEAILRGITDGVLVLDTARQVTLVNPKAAAILQIDAAAVENQPLDCLVNQPTVPDLTRRFYDNFLKSLEKIEVGAPSAEFRLDVERQAVIVTLAPVALGADDARSMVTVLRDISKEAEIERIKNEFISTVSHELRTPLTSIKGYADLLASATAHVGELNPMQRRFVQVIQSNTNRLANLVNDILEISRIESGRVKLDLESLDMVSLINEVALTFEGHRLQKPMNFTLDLPAALPPVYADKARVMQILVNLIGNAWRYTPAEKDITVRAYPRGHFVQVDVADTGIGIVEQDLPYIFDRFFRSERAEAEMVDGTGLGLSITKSLAEMIGGEIWVKSQVNVGSTFSVILPLEAAARAESDPAEGPNLLLIEDDPAVVDLLQPRLQALGYRVAATDQIADALTLARGSSPRPDVIMLDLLLKGAEGFEVLTRLKADQATAAIPVLATALRVDDGNLAAAMVDYVATSFDETQISERVNQALEGKAVNGHVNRVLIIGHDPDTVERFKAALDTCGCQVQRAFNSQQALDMVVSRPDLILVEAAMPGDANASMIEQLHQSPETKDIPIIAITDKVIAPDAVKVLSRGQLLSVEAVVAEIEQISHNVKDGNNQPDVRMTKTFQELNQASETLDN